MLPKLFLRLLKKLKEPRMVKILAFIFVVIFLIIVAIFNRLDQDEKSVLILETSETMEELASGITAREIREAYRYALLSADVYSENGYVWQECQGEEGIKKFWEPVILTDLPERPDDASDWQSQWDSKIEFKVWRSKSNDDENITFAIAFRGTDGGDDFLSNFRWITRFNPLTWDQYDMARTLIKSIEQKFREDDQYKNKNIRIVTTGHSLGGCLAQQAAYASSSVKKVYAFDSTVVTGFYSVPSEIKDHSKMGMRIYRIHEAGEILAYLRYSMSLIYPVVAKNPKIVEVQYNFDRGGAVGQHSMQKLACRLRKADPELSDQSS